MPPLSQTDDAVADEVVGTVLNAMSSGERIWYRFGALVCWALERQQGRRQLVDAIKRPEIFLEVANSLLAAR